MKPAPILSEAPANTSRREFLKTLLRISAGATAASVLASCGLTLGPPQRPNIVVVLVDDLATGVMGKGSRFPFLKTPHLNRLQREGTTFDNTFVPSSVCSPSRASLLTGSYPYRHGVSVNDIQEITEGRPNFPDLLKEAGYTTGFVGKWHMNTAISSPRLNFDYWLSFAGQGVYHDPTLNENGRTFEASGYITDLLTDYAVDFIREPKEQPFCLMLSHKAGHAPFSPAPRHKQAFPNARLPEPPNFRETFANKPKWQRMYKMCGLSKTAWEECRYVPDELPLEPWDPYDRVILEHLRTLLAVDESLGRVYAALESTGQLEDTVVIFTSDNGFMLGAHRLSDKRVMYEESIRVPLTIRHPAKFGAGHHVKQFVSTLDLAPTVLDLARQDAPKTMVGKSLLPLMEDESIPWRDSVIYTYAQGLEDAAVPYISGIRTKRWKYSESSSHIRPIESRSELPELYDLENDPYELRNLAHDPAYTGHRQILYFALRERLDKINNQP